MKWMLSMLALVAVSAAEAAHEGEPEKSFFPHPKVGSIGKLHRVHNARFQLPYHAATMPDEDRIVRGYEVKLNEFPWVVGLWHSIMNRPFCGGSLLTNKWVLTAAHCVHGIDVLEMEVVLGDHDASQREEAESRIKLCSSKLHPDYSSSTTMNDIALLELCRPAKFSAAIQPIAIAPQTLALDRGSSVTVAGWGTMKEGGETSDKLLAVELRTQSAARCKTAYSFVTDQQLCAAADRKDSCQGDSGGALWWTDPLNQRIYQVGIVSSGRGCAREGSPGIYTKVSEYSEWIMDTMAKGAATSGVSGSGDKVVEQS